MNFICAGREYCTREKHVCAPVLRKVFSCKKDYRMAAITIAAVGFYKLFLNGKELTKGYFAPYISNPNDYVYYDRYDISGELEENNVLSIMLGNGFSNPIDSNVWGFEQAAWRSAPKVALSLVADGEELLTTDGSFEVHESAITFDDVRAGERYDARKYNGALFLSKEPFEGKNALLAEPPAGEWKECKSQNVRVYERLKPSAITPCEGGYVYDFGYTGAGVYRLNITAEEGQVLDLRFAEALQHGEPDYKNTYCDWKNPQEYIQHDVYVCRAGEQSYVPSFTYHGFRYIVVKGITKEQAKPSLLTALMLTNDAPATGLFLSDNDILNGIERCTLRSNRSNMIVIPTDCPQREKNGWTGDVNLSAEQFLYHGDYGDTLREWLANVRKAQKPTGQLPGVVPTSGFGYAWGNGPNWDGVLVELTYELYRFYGQKTDITDNLGAILLYFEYLKSMRNESGCISFGLGDWCETNTYGEDGYATPNEVTDTLTSISLTQKAAELMKEVEINNGDVLAFRDELVASFRKKYLVGGVTTVKTQTAQSMAIVCGAVPEEYLQEACAALADLVEGEEEHFKVGVIGAKHLFDALTIGGYTSLAYRTIARNDFPSFGYWLDRGATTLWEAFNLLSEEEGVMARQDGGRLLSLNHHFWGSVTAWFYRVLAGIDIKSADTVVVAPRFIDELNEVKARTGNGINSIAVMWQKTGNEVSLTVENTGYRGKIIAAGFRFVNGSNEVALSEGKQTYILYR